MKLIEMAVALDAATQKKMNKVVKAFTTELKRFDKSAKVEVTTDGPFKATVVAELNHWMRPEDINAMWEDLTDAVKKADDNGHIHSLEEHGSGEEFVEALLSSLKPGMKLKAEAFFPTVGFKITWKQIIKK